MEVLVLVLWSMFAASTGLAAREKGRSALRWWGLGVALGPLALLVALLLPGPRVLACPHCGSEFCALGPE